MSKTESDLLWHMAHGYQLKTSSLGDNPILRRLKDNTEVRATANRRTIETLQKRGLIAVAKPGTVLNPSLALNVERIQRGRQWTPEEREATERRLIEINRRLGFVSSPETRDDVVPELDAEEMDALYEERDLLLKELDEEVD